MQREGIGWSWTPCLNTLCKLFLMPHRLLYRFPFFIDLVCSIITHTFFQPICEWAIRSKKEEEGPNSHSQMFVHSHTIASSVYMILSTQNRVQKPENLHQQYMSFAKERDIPRYPTMWVMDIPMGLGLPWCMLSYLIGCLLEIFFGFQKFLFLKLFVCFITIFGLNTPSLECG